MSVLDLQALSPLLVLGGGAVLLILLLSIRRGHSAAIWLSRLVLAGAGASLALAARAAPRQVTGILLVDRYALFFFGLLIAIAVAVSVMSRLALLGERRPEELHVLLLLATLGAALLSASSHFASLALGLETLSVSLFGLIAYRRDQRGAEAAMKYLLLSGASSALLLFGMALTYAAVGTMVLSELSALLGSAAAAGPLVPAGLALMMVGFGFKLALVPFHMWAADVYQGAPAPITAFVATASKAAVFALFLRFFHGLDVPHHAALLLGIGIISGLSMLTGNLLALLQTNVKRLLAYSSIAHLGYLLLCFLAGGRLGLEAAGYYLVAYSVTVLGSFAIVTVLSRPAALPGEAEDLEDYRGLFWRRPLLAALFTACLLSLAGIPLTAGFIGKLYVLAAALHAMRWVLALLLVASSAIGLFYYLRVVVVMFAPLGADEPTAARPRLPAAAGLLLAVLALLLLWLGVLPGALQLIIRLSVVQAPL